MSHDPIKTAQQLKDLKQTAERLPPSQQRNEYIAMLESQIQRYEGKKD